MSPSISFSPVSLSYVAALRGTKPRVPGNAFAYAMAGNFSPDALIGLAASNPEGSFFGLIKDQAVCSTAAAQAMARHVGNVTFMAASPADALARLEKNPDFLPVLDYLCCDESLEPFTAVERMALFDLAAQRLLPGGLFGYTYRAYSGKDGHLRFLVREFAPEMNAEQAAEFARELKKLGAFYFQNDPALAARLDDAIARNMPDDFFALFDKETAPSATFDTMVALRPRGLVYAGDSQISSNYIELSIPPAAQQVILTCRDNILYEPIKDFALNRMVRSDIWCRQPAPASADPVELFGGFSYGITLPREKIPSSFEAQGKTIPLDSALYAKLIELLTLIPASIGDILSHPNGKDFSAEDVLGAIQILVACGLARPMRGISKMETISSIDQPRLAVGYNRYLGETSINGLEMPLASPVMGDVITLSPRDALVMQALDRAGLANSVAALLPELERLAKNPGQAARVMDVTEPTADIARQMIEDTVSRSIIQWYAYGLIEAA